MSLRLSLMSAGLALLFSVSAAMSIPSPLSIFHPSDPNTTISSLLAPPRQYPNLTFMPWPHRPYQVQLYARFGFPDLVTAIARPFHGTRPVNVLRLQDFLRQFGENMEQESPIPGYAPRLAQQSFPDIESYTMWTISFNEGLLGYKLPTEWALLALDEISSQLGRYGPANLFFTIKEARSTYSYGFLEIVEFGGPGLTTSLTNGKGFSDKLKSTENSSQPRE